MADSTAPATAKVCLLRYCCPSSSADRFRIGRVLHIYRIQDELWHCRWKLVFRATMLDNGLELPSAFGGVAL